MIDQYENLGPPESGTSLSSLDDLVRVLKTSEWELRSIAAAPMRSYNPPRWQKKDDGSARRIEPPQPHLKSLQKSIGELFASWITSPIAFGIRGRTQFDAAVLHQGAEVLLCNDVENFHGSITVPLVRTRLHRLGMDDDLIEVLVRLVTLHGRLPQGSPASPALANLIMAGVDERLHEEAERCGATVTRYVDDMGVSGPNRRVVDHMADVLLTELRILGLRVNRSKWKLMGRNEVQRIHGLGLNPTLSVPKEYRRRLRSDVRRAVYAGCTDEERRSLLGRIAYVGQLHRSEAKRLRNDLKRFA